METLLIPRNVTSFLQAVRDAVNYGYPFWTSGEISTLKAEALCEKFHDCYDVLASRHRRDANRLIGKASAYLWMYPRPGGDRLDWLLLASKGSGKIHEREKLYDHHSGQRRERLHWRHYEIVQLKDKMTWRLRREVADSWEKKLVSAARKSDPADLDSSTRALCTFPMFTGIRKQVLSILSKANRTRIRHNHTQTFSLPSLPIMIRVKVYDNPARSLGLLVDEYRARLQSASLVEAVEDTPLWLGEST
jgi:hypothetical protein